MPASVAVSAVMSMAVPVRRGWAGVTPRTAGWRRRASVALGGHPRHRPDRLAPPVGPVVTITAALGAGGPELADGVAAALGLRLLDDDLTWRVADALGLPVDEVASFEERFPSALVLALVWSGMAGSPPEVGGAFVELEGLTRVHHTTAALMLAAAADPLGAVVVGRGAPFVLAGHRRALHVRLDAPVAWRTARLAAGSALDEAEATVMIDAADLTARTYARRAHRADVHDPGHYGLVLDGRDGSHDELVALVAAAARQRWARQTADLVR